MAGPICLPSSCCLLIRGDASELIRHLILDQTVFAESDCPVNPRKDWIPFAMQDPALLHATLLFSAWQLATLHGNLPTPEVMYHKEESIRWLNKSLLKPNHIPTDSTIAVVACLTKVEVVVP